MELTQNALFGAFLVFGICLVRTFAAPTSCSQLSDAELQKRFESLNNVNCSSHIFPPELLKEHPTEEDSLIQLYVESRSNGIHCPDRVEDLPNSASAKENERSICPWYYAIDHDRHRFPASLPIAMSKCRHPVGMDETKYICEPVYKEITVLIKEECDKVKYPNLFVVREELYQMPVAVVAARDRNIVNSEPESDGPQPVA